MSKETPKTMMRPLQQRGPGPGLHVQSSQWGSKPQGTPCSPGGPGPTPRLRPEPVATSGRTRALGLCLSSADQEGRPLPPLILQPGGPATCRPGTASHRLCDWSQECSPGCATPPAARHRAGVRPRPSSLQSDTPRERDWAQRGGARGGEQERPGREDGAGGSCAGHRCLSHTPSHAGSTTPGAGCKAKSPA